VKLQRFGGKPSTRSGEDPRYTSHVGQNLFLDAARCKWYAYPEKWFLAFKGRTYYHLEHTLRDILLGRSVGRDNIHRLYKLHKIGPLASQPPHQFVPLTVALDSAISPIFCKNTPQILHCQRQTHRLGAESWCPFAPKLCIHLQYVADNCNIDLRP
jgi:hypothetical protein